MEGISDAAMKEEMQRQLEEQMAKEREKRIEHTMQMALRRIRKRDLTRGWIAWYDCQAERARRLRMLAAAGARLLKPKLAFALQHWREALRAER